MKIFKTGSSTNVGINIRIATKVATRLLVEKETSREVRFDNMNTTTQLDDDVCSYTSRHGREDLLNREDPYLLWSFIRDPASRALSEYYHLKVSRRGEKPTIPSLHHALDIKKNFQFKYMADHHQPETLLDSPSSPPTVWDDDSAVDHLIEEYILRPYHFVGIRERTLESLAVMKLLWGLETEDFVVLSAKISGGYDGGRFNGRCTKIQKPPNPLPTIVQSYIDKDFHEKNIDYRLYEMVNQKLNDTIQMLGSTIVENEVQRLKALQQVAERACLEKAIFPCSSNGTLQLEAAEQSCYSGDTGCGYRCVDESLQHS